MSKSESRLDQRLHRRAHRSVCSDVRKLQSMDVLKLQSTQADTKCPCHILAYIRRASCLYIYSNLLDISTSYFIKILSYMRVVKGFSVTRELGFFPVKREIKNLIYVNRDQRHFRDSLNWIIIFP